MRATQVSHGDVDEGGLSMLGKVKDKACTEQVFGKDSSCDARGVREGEWINCSRAFAITRPHPCNILSCCLLCFLPSAVLFIPLTGPCLLRGLIPAGIQTHFSVLLRRRVAEVRNMATSSACTDQCPQCPHASVEHCIEVQG